MALQLSVMEVAFKPRSIREALPAPALYAITPELSLIR
jgi:hypothetical protein